uniref:Cohesin-associated protein Pds5 n=1 Tax=Mycena chlorophos TaxID=658473 RepID=A0ABQ0KV65_MYCCL|nr:predicted protein [Mycena chlorophos]
MAPATRHGQHKLAFRGKLVEKGQTVDALIKKLQSLHNELAAADQEHFDPASLSTVRKDLIDKPILLHKDKGVKAYAACCLADILRLTAPDAPYTQAELRDIFQFFFRQLNNNLKGHDPAYYTEYYHLLQSLAEVKSVVLVCDLPNADDIIKEVFTSFFQMVQRDLQKKVEMFLAEILIALIDEAQTIPTDVLDLIMSQFKDKQAFLEQPSYRLAVQVCNATADKLQRHVSQYFAEIMVADREDDYEDVRVAHELVKRLYHSCPTLLHSVIPQLEQELQADDLQIRLICTHVLGQMFADKTTGIELTTKYKSTWEAWLKRRNDKAPAVRLKFVEVARGLLDSAYDVQRDAIEQALRDKLIDPDEKVRAGASRLYGQLDYETALHHVSVEQLHQLGGRGADKKPAVRQEALRALGRLYSLAYPEIESRDASAITHFGWIPNELISHLKIANDNRQLVHDIFDEFILPLPSASASTSKTAEVDEAAWTDRLLIVFAYLDDEPAKNVVLAFTGVQRNRPTIWDHFLESCIANNGGVIDENEAAVKHKLAQVVKYIASSTSDPHKTAEDLNAFAKLNEQRLYKLIKTCMDPQTDVKGLVKALTEFSKRIENLSAPIAPTMNWVIRRSSLMLFNTSSIPTLLKRLQKSNNEIIADTAFRLLGFAAKHYPALYRAHVGEIVKGIAGDKEKQPRLVEVSLQALAELMRQGQDDKAVPLDKRTVERIQRLATEGTFRQAKFAARFLAFSKRPSMCLEVVETISEGLQDATPEVLVAYVASLSQFARHAPDTFEHKSEVLVAFLVNGLIMVGTQPLDDEMDTEEEWADESEISDNLRAKIYAIKTLRNRALAHVGTENAVEIAKPVLKMLVTLLQNNGSTRAEVEDDKKVMSRMRLYAALSLLHLAQEKKYADLIAPRFLKLALVVQDSCFDVRLGFLKKMITIAAAATNKRPFPALYNVIPFLTVHDPETEVQDMAKSYIRGSLTKVAVAKQLQVLELVFLRLLHVLAHHPDFGTSEDEMLDIAKYIQFYIQQVGTPDTISLLYLLAMKGKTVRDADDQYTENLYITSELAQELIKIWAHNNNLNIATYPGHVKLPKELFVQLGKEKGKEVISHVYLPEEMQAWVKDQYTSTKEKKERDRKERAAAKRKAPPKATNGDGGAAPKRRRRRSGRTDDDESGTEASDHGMEEGERSSEPPAVPMDEDEESEPDDGEVKLGRGQRSKAKRKQARAARKSAKQGSPSSEG